MARLPDPLDTLTPAAKQVYDKITAKRGAVRGPFASLMHHPALASGWATWASTSASAARCPATSASWPS
jgi:hypothetical protein